jgi:7-keto-8-aminopelargonate synthetase-like enzyme
MTVLPNRRVDSRTSSLSDFAERQSSDLFTKVRDFQDFLADLKHRDYDKFLYSVVRYDGARALVRRRDSGEERLVQAYCLADYLDLARHPAVVTAAEHALREFGASVSSVSLIAGSCDLHVMLEAELAAFLGLEGAVLFQTGQAANASTIAALVGQQDFVVVDKQVHSSVLEGVRLSGCRWTSFAHSDPDRLRSVLAYARRLKPDRGILVVIEGVYGIDGDIVPVEDIVAVSREFGARVLMDDAHGIGAIGVRGRGVLDFTSENLRPDIVMGSLSKALGSLGGFVAADRATVDYLRYFCKSITFSVGLSPPHAAAALAALRLIATDPGLVAAVGRQAMRLRDGLSSLGVQAVGRSRSPIVSVRIGSESLLRDVVRDLFNAGVWAEGLPSPAVMRGDERLRFRIRLSHADADINEAVNAMADVLWRHGLLKPPTQIEAAPTPGRREAQTNSVIELVTTATRAGSLSPSWISRRQLGDILLRRGHWASIAEAERWFVESGCTGVLACARAKIAAVTLDGRPVTAGLVGHLHCLPGAEEALARVLDEAITHLSGRVDVVVAPVQAPCQVLGAGTPGPIVPGEPPFLEYPTDSRVAEMLLERGFESRFSNRYRRVGLSVLQSASASLTVDVRLRPFQRDRLFDEVAAVAPILNRTIATLPLCAAVPTAFLQGVVSDLRDLILPGLWWVAELDGHVIGVVASFPNVASALREADGAGDVSDIETFRVAAEQARVGFVSWLGVDPGTQDRDRVCESLLRAALNGMKQRNIETAWLSWELHDGRGPVDAAGLLGLPIIEEADYRLWTLCRE